MSINANITSVVSASAGSTHSGSFAKLYVTHATIFERIDFGYNHSTRFVDGYEGFGSGSRVETSNVIGTGLNVAGTAGTYIDGPIAAFKVTSGGCLAYDTK